MDNCNHCFHIFRGALYQVLPDGHIKEKCCHCSATRTIHMDHAIENMNNKNYKMR